MTKTVLIYLHGFLSSPQSEKAKLTQAFMTECYPDVSVETPEIANYPDVAKTQLEELMGQFDDYQKCFIGSSMGGFLATYLVEKYGGKAVLINPAVTPHILLKHYLGKHVNPYTQKTFELVESHIDILKNMKTTSICRPNNIWALVKKGDETLDYREAEELYKQCKLTIDEGGDHSFSDYGLYLREIGQFLFSK